MLYQVRRFADVARQAVELARGAADTTSPLVLGVMTTLRLIGGPLRINRFPDTTTPGVSARRHIQTQRLPPGRRSRHQATAAW
ncbi:hypothetical protein CQ393_01685 [Stenotrophomonas sp. MYb238]|uniref:hypothetical protein n=1 Tax=Stenotrophomonas sp. MYb238 TaxID=2040281 RepID=UPI0012928E93|nr:hypothetical protein [Stenotrophomonas sp. MYb238]MQP74608.1 hypothetical protein [Stenotrophomonas sp. MYb238]